MGAGKDGKQPITIDWSVTDPSGKKLGTVSQKNEGSTGSLDGSWGKTADAAAAAAAQEIVQLSCLSRRSEPARTKPRLPSHAASTSDGNMRAPPFTGVGPLLEAR